MHDARYELFSHFIDQLLFMHVEVPRWTDPSHPAISPPSFKLLYISVNLSLTPKLLILSYRPIVLPLKEDF